MDKDVQVRQKEDAKYKKRTACLLLCLSYGCECPGWVRDPDFLKENDSIDYVVFVLYSDKVMKIYEELIYQ